MKRLAVTISLILVVVLALSFVYVSRVAADPKVIPSVQMLSTSYTGVSLPTGAGTTVATLSFSVAVPAKLEVTSDNFSFGIPVNCTIRLDGTSLAGTASVVGNDNPDLTVTDSSVAAGSHTLTVICSPISTTTSGMGFLSAIITTGL